MKKKRNKIRELFINILLVLLLMGAFGYVVYDYLFAPYGYYEEDLNDIDGDGYYYKYIEP